jgi:hypothetical protein
MMTDLMIIGAKPRPDTSPFLRRPFGQSFEPLLYQIGPFVAKFHHQLSELRVGHAWTDWRPVERKENFELGVAHGIRHG